MILKLLHKKVHFFPLDIVNFFTDFGIDFTKSRVSNHNKSHGGSPCDNHTTHPIRVGSFPNSSLFCNSLRPYGDKSSFPGADSFKAGDNFGSVRSKVSPGKISPMRDHTPRHRQNYINPCNPSRNMLVHTSYTRRWYHVGKKIILLELL